MPDELADLTLELLRQIRSEQSALRSEMGAFREAVEHRFQGLKSDMLEVKRSLRGLTYYSTVINGRLEEVETRVDRLGQR